ncbi:MAG TPA: hypothetical protein VHY84_14810 [Bryobacteraceae bacterium]|jgi:hypothetical protein|nr:hypothetical protein [Bryobacteraceae bacterium]
MSSGKNTLQIAGDHLAVETAKARERAQLWIGRSQGIRMAKAMVDAADAAALKHIKDAKIYRDLGMDWHKFCILHLGIDHKTADQIIDNYSTFGDKIFDLARLTGISANSLIAVAEQVDKDGLDIGGEKIPLTTTNAPRLQQAVKALIKQAKDAEASALTADVEKTKAITERDNARKGAAEANRKLREALSPKAFADADEDHQVLLRVQSNWDFGMSLLNKVRERELSPENEARYIGLCEYLYRSLLQVADDARANFGRGANLPDPSDALWLNNEPDTSRNLLSEYQQKGKK